jgi:acyl-CoA synthetase (AMP-forming)/AMP-acid ligase II/3-oxoacyl-(acyl-carrier-protein) synthase/acyl carrier protein
MSEYTKQKKVKNIAELIFINAETQPDKISYRFINSNGSSTYLTSSDLAHEVSKLASVIRTFAMPGDTIILGAQPGLEYVISFYACLLAGTIAVPVFPPVTCTMAERFVHIIQDAKPKLVICDKETVNKLNKGILFNRLLPKMMKSFVGINSELENLLTYLKEQKIRLISSEDRAQVSSMDVPTSSNHPLAFLQYTSGSTGAPKGVMISHENLLDNFEVIRKALRHHEQSHKFSWLPPYHDMGLIAGILEPLYVGFPATLMSTIDFIRQPMKWIQYLSDYACTSTGAPNFAFELCVKHAKDNDLSLLDLSAIEVIANGAEPINHHTINQFYEIFAPAGLRRGAIFPCYGLAEATVMVSAKPLLEAEKIITVNTKLLSQNKVQLTNAEQATTLVSSGIPQMPVKILNTATGLECREGEVGDIWVAGKSISRGYFQNQQATEQAFGHKLNGEAVSYLATGDIGFLHEQELFICGRKKDLIIINGQNFYPQDIEYQAILSSDKIRRGGVVAYSQFEDGKERIIVVCEIKADTSSDAYPKIAAQIQENLAKTLHLSVDHLYFIPPKMLPKTTSGKLQRRACAEKIEQNALTILYHKTRISTDVQQPLAAEFSSDTWLQQLQITSPELRQAKLNSLLANEASQILNLAANEHLSLEHGLFELGFDSIKFIQFQEKIKKELGVEPGEDFLFNFPSIDKASKELIAQLFPEKTSEIADKNESNDLRRSAEHEPIAVIGMSAVFPGARNIDEFWHNLVNEHDAISDIPTERFDVDSYYSIKKGEKGRICTKKAGIIENIEHFDAAFFNINTKEAELLDPQQRLLLQQTWLAFEQAKMNVHDLKDSNTGVFIGISTHDYEQYIYKQQDIGLSTYLSTGNATSTASGRLSHFFGFHGPCLSLDTACSSSLVAINEACMHLQNGACDLAVSGGVNIILCPDLFISFSQAGMLAADGKCKTFDAKADGYVRGEGCGVVILKRLSDAIRDKDEIIAVIQGSSVVHDGLSSGLTVPNGQAQQQLIRTALANSKLSSTDVCYLECHGTGTSLGDPIEVQAVNEVFTARKEPLFLGSVKANIGHLEAAAGIAGFIKVLLCLQHRTIPAQINFDELNPKIKLNDTLRINIQPERIAKDKKFIAAINSFGFSGTNAHVILSEAPLPKEVNHHLPLPQQFIFVLSAKTEQSCKNLHKAYLDYLSKSEDSLANICYTAAIGRKQFNYRVAVLASSKEELISQLLKTSLSSITPCTTEKALISHDLSEMKEAFLAGKSIDWSAYYEPYKMALHRVPLPSYPFTTQRYWVNNTKELNQNLGAAQFVMEKIATYSEIELEKLCSEAKLRSEVGLDSISWAELSASLNSALKGPLIDQNIYIHDGTVGDLIDSFSTSKQSSINLIKKKTFEFKDILNKETTLVQKINDWHQEEINTLSIRVDNSFCHKKNKENVLVSRFSACHFADNLHLLELVRDKNHAFFYEHEMDHIPGMYLLESIRQCAEVVFHSLSTEKISFILNSITSEFFLFAEHDIPLFVIAHTEEATAQAISKGTCSMQFLLVQNMRVLSHFKITGTIVDQQSYQRMRSA